MNGGCPGIYVGPPPGGKNDPHPTEKPEPTDNPSKKPSCEPKDYVTVTEMKSTCLISRITAGPNSTPTTTTCSPVFSLTMTACPPLQGFTSTGFSTIYPTSSLCTKLSTVFSTSVSCLVGTDSNGRTTTSTCTSKSSPIVGYSITGGISRTTSSTSTKSVGCTLAPLIYGEDEGDNTGLPRSTNATTSGITIPTLSMKDNRTTTGSSCPLSPLDIDDDEGDNPMDSTIVISTIWSKSDVKSLTKHLSAPTLIRFRTSKQLLAPTLIHLTSLPTATFNE